jgi:CMP/dCMP kinase
MVRMITISREYGSGGGPLAEILAHRLAWRLVDDPLVADVAARLQTSPQDVRRHEETVDPWFHRIVRALWRGGYEGAVARTENEAPDADAIAALWHRVIREAAEIGDCVAVGRGGQCLLQRRPDAFHVRVYAPMRQRIERLRHREPEGADLEAAAHARDRRRADYIRYHFNQDWTNPHLYHLMLCSSIGLERAADTVLAAAGLSGVRR